MLKTNPNICALRALCVSEGRSSMGSNDKTPSVSIVVPMYMTERYLAACVESIRAQTLENIEVILVDDGSPDGCGAIADRFAKLDSRIKVVHRGNGGLGPARNSGMEVATGKFIGFVDSDDWVEPEMYKDLLRHAEEADADAAIGGMTIMSNGSVTKVDTHPYAGRIFQGPEELFELRKAFYGAPTGHNKRNSFPVSVCRSIYRRSLLQENAVTFRDVRSEDILFNIAVCRLAKRIVCANEAGYFYRKDGQPSITKSFKRETMLSFFSLFSHLESMANEEPERYRIESLHAGRRRIVDYTRVLVLLIEGSFEDNAIKNDYIRTVISNPLLLRACDEFHFSDFPIDQALFFAAVKRGHIEGLRLLAKMKLRLF